MCDGDYIDVDVEEREWRRARKARACVGCRETIRRGDLYHHWRQLADGSWNTWNHCARCWALCLALWAANGGEGIDPEFYCGEKWEENFGDLPDSVARLAFLTPEEGQALTSGRA